VSSSESHRELFERVPIGLYRTTPAGEIVDVNPALVNMLGYPDKETLLRETAGSVYARPESRSQWLAEMEARGTVTDFEAQWRRRDGSIIWVEENSYAARDESGLILYIEGSTEDITARREMEAHLAEEKARFEQLFAASPEAIVLCANDGTILRMNEEFTHLFGYSPDEAIGRNVDELVTPDDDGLQSEAAGITQQIADGQGSFVETRRQHKDGHLIDVSILGKPVTIGEDQVAVYGIYRDISERVAIQKKFMRENQRFEQLFAVSPEAVVLCRPDGTVLRTNTEFTNLFGFEEEEAIGQHIDELVAKGLNGLHEHANNVTEAVAGGKTASVETRRRKKNGDLVDVSILGRDIYLDGKQAALYAIYRDISARVAMERKLEQEKARFEQLFAASPEAIVLCANDGSILRMNEEFTRLFGYTPEEALGRDVDELVSPQDAGLQSEAKGITQQVADGEGSFIETQRRHKDGHLIHVSILGKSIEIDGDQIAIYGIYRDISARVEAEASLAATRRKVEQLHEAADALGAAEKEEGVYAITVGAAESVLGFSLGVLCVLEEDEFICQAVSSEIQLDALGRKKVDPVGIAAQSLASGQPVIVTDPNPEELPNGLPKDSRSLICAPIGELGIFQAASQKPDAFGEEDGRLLAILLGHTAVAVARLRAEAQLIKQARHDALTGVFNRHYFNELIAQEVLRASRYDHPIGLLMIDVDRFKQINDHYGHNVGDMVLKEIASVLKETVRATDMIVRYGGDEFLVVLTETGEHSEEAAARIREAVRENEKLREISEFDISVSVGSIFWHPDAEFPIEHALAKADERMYEDKRKGS